MIKISDSLSEKYQHSTFDFDDDTTPLKKLFNKYPKWVIITIFFC